MTYEEFIAGKAAVAPKFGGLMTVPARAIKAGRFGVGVELNKGYFMDGAAYCAAAENAVATPSLFDVMAAE